MLNRLLADEQVLHATMRDYHWNATGPEALDLQQQFAAQAGEVAEWMNQIARWTRSIGAGIEGSWGELTGAARVLAVPGRGLPVVHMLAQVIALHEEMIAQLRADCAVCGGRFRDFGTVEFLTLLSEQHEHAAVMLRTRLEPDGWEVMRDPFLNLPNHE